MIFKSSDEEREGSDNDVRVTRQNKRGCSRKHNDRNFDIEKAVHLNPNPARENIYENIYKDNSITFEEAELRFYKEHFQHMLDERNEKYIRYRKKEHIWDMERFMTSRQYTLESTIFQVGNKDEHADADFHIVYDWVRKNTEDYIIKKYGQLPYVIVDSAVHYDETTPHAHERKVWIYHDEQGRDCIGQEKALEEIGVPLPNPDLPVSRTNNRKMTFDAEILALTQQLVIGLGYDIETVPLPQRRKYAKNRDVEQFVRDKYAELIEENKALKSENRQLEHRQHELEEKIKASEDHLEQLEQRAQEAQEQLRQTKEEEKKAQAVISYSEELIGGKLSNLKTLGDGVQQQVLQHEVRKRFGYEEEFLEL